MNYKELPSKDEILKSFFYCSEDGTLRYRNKPHGGVGLRNVGDIAGTIHKSDGYSYLKVNGVRYAVHRLVYTLHKEQPPQNGMCVDHINGDKSDNRIENLRLVSYSANQKNTKVRKNNTSGFPGVSYNHKYRKWCVYLSIDGRRKNCGSFDDRATAVSHAKQLRDRNEYITR